MIPGCARSWVFRAGIAAAAALISIPRAAAVVPAASAGESPDQVGTLSHCDALALVDLLARNGFEVSSPLVRSVIGNLRGKIVTMQEALETATAERDQLRRELESTRGELYRHAKTPEALSERWYDEWLPRFLAGDPRARPNIEDGFSSERPETLTYFSIDIDFFKKVNSTFGHPNADIILKRLIRKIKDVMAGQAGGSGIRAGNGALVRYGGEEFFVVAKNLPDDRAQLFAQTLLAALRADHGMLENLPNDPPDRATVDPAQLFTQDAITVSMGVTSMQLDGRLPYESAVKLMGFMYAKSNERLHKAKNSGRDRARFVD